MKWLTLFSLLIRLALQIITYLERRDAIEAGRAEATKDLLERADEMAMQAKAARDGVDLSPDAELLDPNNEDVANERGDGPSGTKDNMHLVQADPVQRDEGPSRG